MADFKEVMEQFKYMCDKMNSCNECPLYPRKLHVPDCGHFIRDYPVDAESIITEWHAKNKPMTNAEKFRQVFGDAPIETYKCSNINCDCIGNCNECEYKDFWEQEYKENK